jgi:hypothetical protein
LSSFGEILLEYAKSRRVSTGKAIHGIQATKPSTYRGIRYCALTEVARNELPHSLLLNFQPAIAETKRKEQEEEDDISKKRLEGKYSITPLRE